MYKTLIVEDSDDFRQTLRSLLDSRFPSMSIEEAKEGKEALEKVHYGVEKAWRFWLSRRSHKSNITYEDFDRLTEKMPLPKPWIIHRI